MERTVFDGLEAVTMYAGKWQLTAVCGAGPRIAFLGKAGGENLLHWDKAGMRRGDWNLMGGHRVWLCRPMADESEDTYAADNEPCRVEYEGDRVVLTAPVHPFTKLERSLGIRVLGDDCFEVVSAVRNTSGLVYSGAVWAPTCIQPEGVVIRIPLGDPQASWDAIKVVIPRKFAGNVIMAEDSQVVFQGDTMVVTSEGRLTKRCVCAPQGKIIAEFPGGVRFTKESEYVKDGAYPMGGCNLAVFIGQDNWMGELESYSVEQVLRPGEEMRLTEVWRVETAGNR